MLLVDFRVSALLKLMHNFLVSLLNSAHTRLPISATCFPFPAHIGLHGKAHGTAPVPKGPGPTWLRSLALRGFSSRRRMRSCRVTKATRLLPNSFAPEPWWILPPGRPSSPRGGPNFGLWRLGGAEQEDSGLWRLRRSARTFRSLRLCFFLFLEIVSWREALYRALPCSQSHDAAHFR